MKSGETNALTPATAKPVTDQPPTSSMLGRVLSGVGYYTGLDKYFVSQQLPTQANGAIQLIVPSKSDLQKKIENTANEKLEEFSKTMREILNIRENKPAAAFWHEQVRGLYGVTYRTNTGELVATLPDGVSDMLTQIGKEKNLDAKVMIEKVREKAVEFYLKRSCWLPAMFTKPWVRAQSTHDFYKILHDLDMKQPANIAVALNELKKWKKIHIPDLVITPAKKGFW